MEHIAVKGYGNGAEIMADWQTIPKALEYMKGDNRFLFLRKFHGFLQESKSHYTPDADGAERLALKYYEYYMMLREFAKKEYGLEILHNIDKFPINMDKEVIGYYRAVLKVLEKRYEFVDYGRNERLYVMRSKVVIVDDRICYENTLIPANDISSKFDIFIAFSTFMIPDHYAIRADIANEKLSHLRLKYGAIPFEEMPFCTSLIGHNPETHDIFGCIPADGNEYQLLAKYLQVNTSSKGHFYTKCEEAEHLGDIDDLIQTHNQKL